MSVAGEGPNRIVENRRPARRRGLHREAVDTLGRRIVSGRIPVGATLPNEADLGVELEVSRTVVREAVKVLAAKGLVQTRPRTGTRVQPRSAWDLIDHDVLDWIVESGPGQGFFRDLFEVRTIIEPQAAAMAAARHSSVDDANLQSLLGQMNEAGDDPGAYTAADLRFHAAILSATHNELLARLTGTLAVAMQAARAITTRIPAGPSSSVTLHQDVAEAIGRSDPTGAREAMQALISYASRDMELVMAGGDDGWRQPASSTAHGSGSRRMTRSTGSARCPVKA